MSAIWLGVDVGGTFTDAVLLCDGKLHAAKAPTTPDQSIGVLAAIDAVCAQASIQPRDVSRFAHGTTVATNALLERRGARVAALLTAGCEDLLELGRQERPSLHDLHQPRPAPLVQRTNIIAVHERMGARQVTLPLAVDSIATSVGALAELDVDAVAICLLHAWRDPTHEVLLAAAIRERLPGVHVVASHELSRELREFERASTITIDAYLTPVLAPYLRNLAARSAAHGLPAPLVMQSSGGLDQLEAVAQHAARAVFSGPAGGLVAARSVLHATQLDAVLCLDVGGTSCDVALVTDAEVTRATTRTVAGLPLQLEMADMHTIGAGGSSIVCVDAGGALVVGPHSAGATPGPAAYGRGGTELTLTDAHLLLGHMQPDALRRWGIEPDLAAAERAADALGAGPPLDVAAGAIELATANMAEAARVVSVARGHDPAGIALLAYGGAGALHACDIALALECRQVLVPGAAGVLSAAGLALADQRREASRTVGVLHDRASAPTIASEVGEWISATASRLVSDLNAPGTPTCSLVQELRYVGQSHTIAVTQRLPQLEPTAIDQLMHGAVAGFEQLHADRYGFRLADHEVQTLTVRVAASVAGPGLQLDMPVDTPIDSPADIAKLSRALLLHDGRSAAAIDLPHGTCLVPEPWQVQGIEAGCLLLINAGGQDA